MIVGFNIPVSLGHNLWIVFVYMFCLGLLAINTVYREIVLINKQSYTYNFYVLINLTNKLTSMADLIKIMGNDSF